VKASKYNFVFPYDGDYYVIYNSRTNAFALLNRDEYNGFMGFTQRGEPIADSSFCRELEKTLFIINDELDELNLVWFKLMATRFNTSRLALAIAPTSNCNFRCTYCFERERLAPVTMSDDTQDALIDFLRTYIGSIKQLHITWYGGEPLMALDVVEALTKRFLLLCTEHNIDYRAAMVTNGYLLSPNVVKRLHPLMLSSIQVTVDGPPKTHDERRFLLGGKPTFQRILSNLCESRDSMPCLVSLRVNIDKNNTSEIDDLISILKEHNLSHTVRPYLGMVHEMGTSYDRYDRACCCSVDEFAQMDLAFRK